MSEVKHTPGPWKLMPREVLEDDSVYSTHIVGGPREVQVCLLESFESAKRAHDNPEMKSAVFEANCRLIAAAPDLYEALESIRRYGLDTLSGRADGGEDDRQWQREAVNEMTKRARIAIEKATGSQS